MNTATFNTLSAARSLEAAGIESKQAEAIVGAIRSSGEASVHKGRPDGPNHRITQRNESYGHRTARHPAQFPA